MQAEIDEQQVDEHLTVNGTTARQQTDEAVGATNFQTLESAVTAPASARERSQHDPANVPNVSQPANIGFPSNPASENKPTYPEGASAAICLPSGDSRMVNEPTGAPANI